jgi:DNA repair exonuclease SbcCD ATPase subunit
MNVMTKNNFIIIDEGFSAADNDNLLKISYLIDTIKKEYDICILISHIEEIKNQEGNIIKIRFNEKTNDSFIEIK